MSRLPLFLSHSYIVRTLIISFTVDPSFFSFFYIAQLRTYAQLIMGSPSSDVIVLAIGIVVAAVYLFRGSLFSSSEPKKAPTVIGKVAQNGTGDPRDFVAKMKAAVRLKPILVFITISFVLHFYRKNGSSSFMVLRLVLLRNTLFGWLKRQSRGTVWPL